MSTTTQKLIIAASLAGIGGGVWYFFIRKKTEVKNTGTTTPSTVNTGTTTPSTVNTGTTPVTLDIYGTDGKVHVASGKKVLGYNTWTGIPYLEPQKAEKVLDELSEAFTYVFNSIVKRSPDGFGTTHKHFLQRAWIDRIYDKSPVPAEDLKMLDDYVKKFSLEDAVATRR